MCSRRRSRPPMRTRSRRSRVPTCSSRTSCRRPLPSSPSAPGSSGCRESWRRLVFSRPTTRRRRLRHRQYRRLIALHPAVGRMFNQLARAITNRWMAPLYRLRAQLGLPRGGHPLFEGQHSPACVLGLFSEVFAARQPDYPPQTVMTGFPFYDSAPTRPLEPGSARVPRCGRSTCRVHAWIVGRVDRR